MDEPDMLLHVTQQLRDKRDRAAALAALTAELEAAGTIVVPECGYGEDSETLRVTSLKRADGEPASAEDGNAVYIETDYRGEHSAVAVVTGWKDLGFTLRYYSGYGTSSAPKGPMTEEQKAERKTLIENNKLMQSVLLTELCTGASRTFRRGDDQGERIAIEVAGGPSRVGGCRGRAEEKRRPVALCCG